MDKQPRVDLSKFTKKRVIFIVFILLVLAPFIISLLSFAGFIELPEEFREKLFSALLVPLTGISFLVRDIFKNENSKKGESNEDIAEEKNLTFDTSDFKIVFKGIIREDMEAFQISMIESLLEEYNRRTQGIAELNYFEYLNWEQDFLLRVKSLYEGVDKVYAVTLSSISDFWVSENDRKLITKYLNVHVDKDINRLFVFQSAYDLAKYTEVLQANFSAYGNQGGVYVTSMEYYTTTLLDQFCNTQNRETFLNKDFGIWEYNKISIFATLEGTNLSFKKFKRNQSSLVGEVNQSEFKEIFRQNDRVVKWDETCGKGKIKEIADKLFKNNISLVGTVTHIVQMNHPNKELLSEITKSIVMLDKIQKDAIKEGININFINNEPWWGKNLQCFNEDEDRKVGSFFDHKYGGALNCDKTYDYILMLQLPSIDDLRNWHRLGQHSDIREKVYTTLVESTKDLYKKLRKQKNNSDRLKLFSEIENKVTEKYLKRSDYIYNKEIEDVTPFKILEDFKKKR